MIQINRPISTGRAARLFRPATQVECCRLLSISFVSEASVPNWVILFDGWAAAYEPNSPAALHLWALLENIPAGYRALLAAPAELSSQLPAGVHILVSNVSETPSGHLRWEQRTLPGLAQRAGANFIHLTSGSPALFNSVPCVISPAAGSLAGVNAPQRADGESPNREGGLPARLRQALQSGGMSRAHGLIWPADLPAPNLGLSIFRLPLILPAVFWDPTPREQADLDLPESYILVHGSNSQADWQRLLDVWSWAAPAIGEHTPLIVAGLTALQRSKLASMLETYRLGDTLRMLPEVSLAALKTVYQRSTALFHPGSISPWGDPLTLALACGKPVVALDTPETDARLGPAGYLIQPGVSRKAADRSLGAALVTLVVEESVAETMADQAKKRSAAWKQAEESFREATSQVYLSLAAK